VLLAINAAFGPADLAAVPKAAFALDTGWVSFPRVKTAVARRCPLWPETIEALKDTDKRRPKPANPGLAGRMFLTAKGTACEKRYRNISISVMFRAHLKLCGFYRPDLGLYTLRHVFRTVADETLDHPAIAMIMGHRDPTMSGLYRQTVSDDRLGAVVDHVRGWLFGSNLHKSR